MLRSYYLSSRFIESDQGRKVSGWLLFLFLIVLQLEICIAPQDIPLAIPRATTSSELHIFYYNSFGLLKFEARLLNSESCNDFLSSWCKTSLGDKTPHKNGSHSDSLYESKLSTASIHKNKTTFSRSWCKPSLGNKKTTIEHMV